MKRLNVVVVCLNSFSEPDVFPTTIDLPEGRESQKNKIAIQRAKERGFQGPFICFDDEGYGYKLARIYEANDSTYLRFGRVLAEISRRVEIPRAVLDSIGSELGMDSGMLIETFEHAESLREAVEQGDWSRQLKIGIRALYH